MKVNEPKCPRDWTRLFKSRDKVALRAKEVPKQLRALEKELEALREEERTLQSVMYRMPKIEMFCGVPLMVEKESDTSLRVEGLGTPERLRAEIYRPCNMGDKPGFNVRVVTHHPEQWISSTEALYWLLPWDVAVETAKRWCAHMDLPEEARNKG